MIDMTNWDDMTPRERDALIAEEVMGLSPLDDELCSGRVVNTHWHGRVCHECDTYHVDEPDEFETRHHYPNFTTGIEAAWQVVEHFYTEGHNIELCMDPNMEPPNDTVPHVCTIRGTENGHHGTVMGKSHEGVAEAICLAALRAKGVDV